MAAQPIKGGPVRHALERSAAEPYLQSEPARELSLGILVVSCDAYSDLWTPFFSLLDRFWPQRPGPLYLVTNDRRPSFHGVVVIPVGRDVSWSDNLLSALRSVDEEYVLLMLEDLFLHGPVDLSRIEEVLEWVSHSRPSHVRLNPSEKPYGKLNDLIGLVPPGAPYRTSTVFTIWRKDVLASLLKPGETAWQFELLGSNRSDSFDGFYSTTRKCFPIINGIIKGKWRRDAVRRLRALGVPTDLKSRAVMSVLETIRFAFLVIRWRTFKWVPWQWRRRIRTLLTG